MNQKRTVDSDEQLRRVRKICFSLPEVTEKLSHGEPTFFVRKKSIRDVCEQPSQRRAHRSVDTDSSGQSGSVDNGMAEKVFSTSVCGCARVGRD